MNPIENRWAWVDKRLAARDYADLADFEAKLREVWAEVPVSLCRKLVGSMRKRARAVISNEGKMTKY